MVGLRVTTTYHASSLHAVTRGVDCVDAISRIPSRMGGMHNNDVQLLKGLKVQKGVCVLCVSVLRIVVRSNDSTHANSCCSEAQS